MRAAEARGEVYMGSMTVEEAPIDDVLPNIATAAAGSSGMPGQPHICNVTGQPGLPGLPGSDQRQDICAPAIYEYKYWNGNDNAITLAKRKYPNQKCFGIPINPPVINFPVGGRPGVDQPCDTPPYCNPPIFSYDSYYYSYGCMIEMKIKTQEIVESQTGPLLTTCWEQEDPLNHGDNYAGCGPIAMAQLLVYHGMPKTYVSEAFGGVHRTEIDELRKLRTNTDIKHSPYKNDAWKFLEEIRKRMKVHYNDDFSTGAPPEYYISTIESFGYKFGYNSMLNYYNTHNFRYVSESIQHHNPVYIYGINATLGHVWILDGYKKATIKHYYADYYFDEYGEFNAEKKYVSSKTIEQVHVNYGWGTNHLFWVDRGIYVFNGTNYDRILNFIAEVEPLN